MIEAIEIQAPDGTVLRGEAHEAGPDWVVLVHDLGEDIDAWRPLPAALVARGLSVLTFDLRGHGGSDGEPDPGHTVADVAAAVALARARGAGRVYLGAAGESTQAAIETGAAEGCDALVLLAPVGDALDGASLPRLSVVSSRDPRQQAAARALHRGPGWSLVANVPVAASGCAVLAGEWGGHVRDYVLSFLGEQLQARPAVRS